MPERELIAKSVRTLKLRVKDKHAAELPRQARAANFVWNYANELSDRMLREHGRWLSAYDLQVYTNGAGKELGLHSHTVQAIGAHHVQARRQHRKRKLAWRKSGGTRRSLGWVPFKVGAARWVGEQVRFNGRCYGVWDSYELAGYTLRSGSFSEDSRGRWYVNVAVELENVPSVGTSAVGIDLGCRDAAITSDGERLHGRWYRREEERLAKAQRARKKKRAKGILAKIKNRRKDAIHKFSTRLVRENGAVFVGNVSAAGMAKSPMGKSSLDAGWAAFKSMLEYKCAGAGVVYECVDERWSTRTCSGCGSVSGPKGLSGLNERAWRCGECGDHHDRDINAAINVRAVGLGRLAGGTYE